MNTIAMNDNRVGGGFQLPNERGQRPVALHGEFQIGGVAGGKIVRPGQMRRIGETVRRPRLCRILVCVLQCGD